MRISDWSSDVCSSDLVDIQRVNAGCWGHVVRDGEDDLVAVLAGHIQVRLDLGALELGAAGLHLDERGPGLPSPGCLEDTVGVDGPLAGLEGHLDVAVQLADRGAHRLDHGEPELANRAHHRQQRGGGPPFGLVGAVDRSEEHTSELQSLMRISYAVFCLKKKKKTNNPRTKSSSHQLT